METIVPPPAPPPVPPPLSAPPRYGLALVIIGLLCLLNLAGTGYLLLITHSDGDSVFFGGKASLPAGLETNEERMALFETLTSCFNEKDFDGLYALFDEVLRVQMPRDTMLETLETIYGMTGRIESGAYLNYNVQQESTGMREYKLFYVVDTVKGHGTLTVTVLQQGREPYRLVGFYVSRQNR